MILRDKYNTQQNTETVDMAPQDETFIPEKTEDKSHNTAFIHDNSTYLNIFSTVDLLLSKVYGDFCNDNDGGTDSANIQDNHIWQQQWLKVV